MKEAFEVLGTCLIAPHVYVEGASQLCLVLRLILCRAFPLFRYLELLQLCLLLLALSELNKNVQVFTTL